MPPKVCCLWEPVWDVYLRFFGWLTAVLMFLNRSSTSVKVSSSLHVFFYFDLKYSTFVFVFVWVCSFFPPIHVLLTACKLFHSTNLPSWCLCSRSLPGSALELRYSHGGGSLPTGSAAHLDPFGTTSTGGVVRRSHRARWSSAREDSTKVRIQRPHDRIHSHEDVLTDCFPHFITVSRLGERGSAGERVRARHRRRLLWWRGRRGASFWLWAAVAQWTDRCTDTGHHAAGTAGGHQQGDQVRNNIFLHHSACMERKRDGFEWSKSYPH